MKKLELFSCVIVILFATSAYGGAFEGSWVKHILAAQQSPIYLDVKDMDGDGKLDVATTTDLHPNEFDSEVAWFRNNGDATAWEKFIISSSAAEDNPITNANGIAIADIDGDGHDDVVVGAGMAIEAVGSVYWFKAPDEPSGAWQRFDIEVNVPNAYLKNISPGLKNSAL